MTADKEKYLERARVPLKALHGEFIAGARSQDLHCLELLADFAAAVAKEARVAEARDCAAICSNYRKREFGPHGTEWVSCEDAEKIGKEIAERIAELEQS